jgi:transposase
MTSYREILRLSAQGISQRSIAHSCGCSRNTVARVLAQAQQKQIEWRDIRDLSEGELSQRLAFNPSRPGSRKSPDYEYTTEKWLKVESH